MLQNLLNMAPVILGVLVGVNVILGGTASILHAFGKSNAESVVGKISSAIAKLIDLIQGNIAH